MVATPAKEAERRAFNGQGGLAGSIISPFEKAEIA
jgi:hypothetical protein